MINFYLESPSMVQPKIEIREAGDSDAAIISGLLNDAFREYEQIYTPTAFAATAASVDEVLRRLVEGPAWVAEISGTIAGTASAVIKEDSLYVRGMAVLPEFRGQHVGELLLNTLEAYAVENKCRRMILSTTPFLHRAIRLYERFGFHAIGEGPADLFGTPLFTMEKLLI